MKVAARRQQFLFDDLVFSTIAICDYIGNLIGFVFHGKNRKKLKWNNLSKYCQDAELERRKAGRVRISVSNVAQAVRHHDRSWISSLYQYRSDLIHYEVDKVGGILSFVVPIEGMPAPTEEPDLTITVPETFAARFQIRESTSNPKEIPIVEAAFWLLEETANAIEQIIVALQQDISEMGQSDEYA